MNLKFSESRHPGEHLVSEANGTLAREQGVLITGQSLAAGAVLGKITASGKYTELDPAAGDGSEVAAGVLYGAVNATAADADCVVHVRSCEVAADALSWPTGISGPEQAQATTELESVDIVQR